MKQMTAGFIELEMPNDDYRAYPALNYSSLKLMYKPALYKKQIIDKEKKEQSHAMSVGTAVHLLILEPHLKNRIESLAKYGHENRKKWQAIRQLQFDNPDTIYFTQDELDTVHTMVRSVKSHDEAFRLYSGPINNEVSFFWKDPVYGFDCKGRADTLNLDEGYVVDLKTTKDAAGFMKECVNFGYHIQAAFYLAGLKAITGKDLDWYWVAVDSANEHDTYVYKMSAQTLKVGEIMVNEYMKTLQKCHETGVWPNGNEGVKDGELPGWYTAQVLKKEEGQYNEFRAT